MSRATSRTHGRATAKLVYTAVAFVLLSLAWNGFAHRFDEVERPMRRNGDVFERAAANPAWTIAALPPPVLPRIAVFGSSQIAVVKSPKVDLLEATPHQLGFALAERGVLAEIVDFSEGGQQTLESLLLYLATRPVSHPRAVVIGLSLFSMLRTDVRPTLLAGIDATSVREALRAALPPNADPRSTETLLAWSRSDEQRVSSRGQTLQERMDVVIGDWLGARVAAIGARRAMFDALIDQPIRRDLVSIVTRNLRQQSTARTYQIGGEFGTALLAVETLARAARHDGVPLFVVLMPFDDARPPVPFTEPTQERVRAALERSAQAQEFTLLDLSHLLGSQNFGDFVDGSPDNLHFDPAGHARVARSIADAIQPALASGRDGSR